MQAAQQRDLEQQLVEDIASFTHDPLGFVLYAYPWGEGDLTNEGPDAWQREALDSIGRQLRENAELDISRPIQEATASGHGVGKSALVSWLAHWAMCTHEDTRVRITAGSDTQLRTATIPEFSKWSQRLICKHWFVFAATTMRSISPGHADTWRLDFIPWNAKQPESFAGLHNKGKRLVVLFDEASQIEPIIWETTEGALTDDDTEIIWCAYGNPTRNTGRFRECWGRHRASWVTRKVDSRTAKVSNKAKIASWIEAYGIDSDFVKVRVLGEFPSASDTQFIPSDLVDAARKRLVTPTVYDPTVLGVDVARYGDDQSVLAPRCGRDARTIPWRRYRQLDTMQLANRALVFAEEIGARAIFVDGGGVGAGVVDRLRQIAPGWIMIVDVQFGARPDGAYVDWFGREPERVANKRAEIWAVMRAWLSVGAIPDDEDLAADLIGPEYGYDGDSRILLEKKEHMKERGLSSPDNGDALALTFALPVVGHAEGPRSHHEQEQGRNSRTGY